MQRIPFNEYKEMVQNCGVDVSSVEDGWLENQNRLCISPLVVANQIRNRQAPIKPPVVTQNQLQSQVTKSVFVLIAVLAGCFVLAMEFSKLAKLKRDRDLIEASMANYGKPDPSMPSGLPPKDLPQTASTPIDMSRLKEINDAQKQKEAIFLADPGCRANPNGYIQYSKVTGFGGGGSGLYNEVVDDQGRKGWWHPCLSGRSSPR